MKLLVLRLIGVNCERCASTIQHMLSNVRGINRCTIDVSAGQAFLLYDPYRANLAEVRYHIEAAGFKAEPVLATQRIPMTYSPSLTA